MDYLTGTLRNPVICQRGEGFQSLEPFMIFFLSILLHGSCRTTRYLTIMPVTVDNMNSIHTPCAVEQIYILAFGMA